ncbi:hypothetical protein GJ496_000898 [Pomphorhynchus laevis]|nr:hypothetical protein GJ496_000898 [Pomphorhynchus laevis]
MLASMQIVQMTLSAVMLGDGAFCQRLKSLLSRNEISSSTLYTATSGQSLQNSKLYSSKGYKRSQSNKANLTLKPLSTDSPDLRTIKILMQDLIRISVGRYNSQQCYIRRKLRGLGVSHPPGHLTNMYMQAAQVRPRKSFYKSKHTHYCYPLNPADIERTQRYLHVESSLNTSANEDLRDTYASSDEVRFQKRDERLNAQHLKAVDDVECCYNDYQNSINDTSYLQNSSSFAEGTLSTARKHALLRSRSNSPHSNSSNQSLRIIKKRRKKHIHSKSSFSVNAAKYNISRRPGWSDSEASVSAITCNSMRSARKWHRDHNALQQSFIGGDNYNGKYNDSSFNSAFNQAPNSIYRQVAYLNVEHDDVDMFNESLQRTSMQCTKLNVHQNSDKIELPSIITGGVQIKAWCRAPYPAEYAAQEKLYICEFCLTYLKSKRTLLRHVYKCNTYGPPGEKIYENCDHSIFEVNGGEHTIFCQNLCLLAKLFLDHKTLHSDVEPFLFYVLTKRDSKGYHIIGYFSKEKSCGKNYNLSCIMVLPNYQKLGYGSFLIDFSYLLSRKQHEIGTPEKPLSQLGRISYNSYWKKVALRHLAKTSRELNLSRVSLATGILPSDLFEGLRIAEVITLCDDKLVILRDMDKFQSYKGPFSSNLVMPSESETMLTKAFNQLSSTTSSAAAGDYCKLLAKCVDDDAMDSNNNDNGDYNNCKEHLSNKSKLGLSNDIFHCVGPHRSLCVYSGVNRMRYNHSQRVRRKYVRLMNRRALRQSGYSQSTTEISKVLRRISCRVSLQNAFGLQRSADIDSPMTLQRFDIPQGGGSAYCCFNANLKDCNHDNRSYGTSCQHMMMHHVKVPKQKATEMNNCKLQSSTSSAPVLLINKRQLSVNDQHLTATTNPALSPYQMSESSSDASIAIDNDDNDEDYKNLSLQSNEGSSSECLLNDSEQNFDKPTSAVKQQQWLSVNSSEVSSHNVSAGCALQNQQNSSANTMSSSTLSSFILSPTFVYSLKSESSSSNADFQDMEQRELLDENHDVNFDHNKLDSEKMISPSILDDSPKSLFADKGIIHSGSNSISSLRNNFTDIYDKDCNVVESTLSQNAEECLLDQVVIRKTDQLIDYRRTDCIHHHNLKEEIASSLSSLSTDEPQSIVNYNINNAKDVKTFNGKFMQRKAVLSNMDDDVHRLVNADLSVSRTTLPPEQQHSAVTELSSLHSPTTAQVPIGTHDKMNKDTSCNHGKATFDRPEHITQKKDVVESALLQRPDSEHRLLSSGFAVQRFDENQPQLLSSPVHATAPVDGQQRCFSNSSCSDDQQRRIIDSRVRRVDQRHITNVNGQIRTPHIFYDQQQHQHRQQRQRCLSGQASYPCSSKHIPVPPGDHHQNNGDTSVQWSLDLPPSHHSCFDKQIYAAQIKRPGTAPPLNYQEGYNNGDCWGTRIFYDDPVKRSFNVQAQQEQHPQLHFNCMRSPIITSVSAAEFSASTNNHEREVLSRTCSAQYDNHMNYHNSLDRMPFPDSLPMHNRQHLSSSSLPFTNLRDNSIAQERILSSSANFVHPPHQIKQHFSVPPTSSQMFAVNDQSQQHRHNQSMNYFDNDIPTALIAADNLNSNFIMNSHQQEVINCANVNSNPYSSNADNTCNVLPSCQHRPPFPQNCFNNTYNCDGGNVSIKSNRHPCCSRLAYCYHSNVNRVFGCASSEGGTSVSNADLPVMRSKSCHPPQDSRFPTHVPNINNDNTVEGCNKDNDFSHHRAVMQAGSATATCVEPQRLVRQPKTMMQHQQQQIAMQHQQVHSSLHNAMMVMTPQQGTTNQLISDSNNADNDFQPHYPPCYQGLNGHFTNDGSNNVNINNSTFNPVEITSISLANYHPHSDMYYSSNNNEEISNAAAQFLNHHDAGVGMLSNERRQAMSPVNGDPTPLLMLPSHVDNRHQIAQAHSYPPRANRSHPSASVFVANNRRMSASPSDLSYSHHHNRQQYQQQPPNTDYHYNNEFPIYSAQTKHNVAANLQMVMYPQHTFMSLSGNGTNDSDDSSNVVGCTNITNATDTSAMPSLLYYAANGQSTTNDSIVAARQAKST